jgi:3-oxoisoapionate kinase
MTLRDRRTFSRPLSLGGVSTVLFLAPPEPETLRHQFPNTLAVGVAGVARSLTVPAMTAELNPTLHALAELNPRFLLYKHCSTFDSSPSIGSIGHALELVRQVFSAPLPPLVVGAPALRRHVIFGHLFAGFGAEVVRLDRHPTMSRHPITPMAEADLRLHLAKQTPIPIGLVDWLTLEAGDAAIAGKLREWRQSGVPRIVLFDTLSETDLGPIGRALAHLAGAGEESPTLPLAGSSAVAHALAAQWRERGLMAATSPMLAPAPADRLVVISGSASPQTAAQIAAAEFQGWTMIRIDVRNALSPDRTHAEFARLEREAGVALAAGRSVVLYSARGPDDPALLTGSGLGTELGAFQGRLLRSVLVSSGVRRACVAGGDTSGHSARQLGIYALEFLAMLAPGAPLCRARSTDPRFEGLELALKGGQCGKPDYFLKFGPKPETSRSTLIA